MSGAAQQSEQSGLSQNLLLQVLQKLLGLRGPWRKKDGSMLPPEKSGHLRRETTAEKALEAAKLRWAQFVLRALTALLLKRVERTLLRLKKGQRNVTLGLCGCL